MQGDHHSVTDLGIWHSVGRRQHHAGVTHQDSFNGGTREVLAIDANPIGAAAREIEESFCIAVGQIAGPVRAVAQALGVGLGVVPVALKRAAGSVDDLTNCLIGVQQLPAVVKLGARALETGVGIEHPNGGRTNTERTLGHARHANDRGAGFGLAIAIAEPATEALGEPRQIALGGFIAVPAHQWIVGVVGQFWRGQHIGQRLAHIVEVRGVESAHVG